MQRIAPLELSEAWDNTGLLLGDRAVGVERVMTCLTLTPESVQEAIEGGVQMVIAHHPLPFKPLAKITTQTYSGGLLWKLAKAGISVYSPHTAWDSASRGINARLAALLSLTDCRPLVPASSDRWPNLGAGRIGDLPEPLTVAELTRSLAAELPDCRSRGVLPLNTYASNLVRRVAICCGSGGSLLAAAVTANCDLFLTGEGTFHTCLEAQAAGIALLMIGHFASERFAMEQLSDELAQEMPKLTVWASRSERDPVANFDH